MPMMIGRPFNLSALVQGYALQKDKHSLTHKFKSYSSNTLINLQI
jgi:hypothetical protein